MSRLHLPSAVIFALADGRRFRAEPHRRAQMRAAIALDPQDDAPPVPAVALERCARQLAAIVSAELEEIIPGHEEARRVPARPILDNLTPAEEVELLSRLLANGVDEEATKKQPAPRRKASFKDRLKTFDADTLALSLHLARTPRETAESLGFVESLMLLEAIYADRAERHKFEAALHGFKLR